MLLFGWFVVGQALLTAAGRSSLSVSIASRYTTPAIFLLCCVLCLVIPCNPTSIKPRAFLAAIVLVLVPYQLKAIERPSERNASRMLAALSMELGVYDEAYTSQIFPSVAWLEELAEPAIEANVAVFGGATLQDQRQRLGEYAGIARRDDCDLTGEVAWQEVGRGFQRVTLLVDGREDERRESMPVIDEAGLYVGQLLRFPEIGSGPTQVRQRYVGYISAAPSLRSMSYRAPGSGCDHAFTTGGRAFKVISPELAASLPHATSTAVVGSHTWSGTDYYRSEVPGYAVFGSYVNSDQDQGSLTLRLARDSVIQVRTGSDNSNQYLVIPDLDNSTYILPVSLDWTYLSFSAEGLPDSFEIILSDQGTGWGQWSAVLLKEPS